MPPCRRGMPGDADATRDTDLLDTCWQDAAAGQFGESATTRSCGWVNATALIVFYSRNRAAGQHFSGLGLYRRVAHCPDCPATRRHQP